MDVPINAPVYCADGSCGHSTYVILNPTTWHMTHLVVKEKGFPHTERLVPLEHLGETGHGLIHLRWTKEELAKMEQFKEIEFQPGAGASSPYEAYEYMMWPYVLPQSMVSLEHQRIPPDELAVRRGARVEATDGAVGVVDEFLIDSADGHITHLVLREGHLWGKKDVAIPVSKIDRIEGETVCLKLDKETIVALPAIPLKKRVP
jgi:hypothetical protein